MGKEKKGGMMDWADAVAEGEIKFFVVCAKKGRKRHTYLTWRKGVVGANGVITSLFHQLFAVER